jgi:Uncharacterized protein conserved in bacteria (DUF2252)
MTEAPPDTAAQLGSSRSAGGAAPAGNDPGRRYGRASGRGTARAAGDEQLSRADRVALGKDARAAAPLESHAEFAPAGKRAAAGAGQEPGAGAGAGAARADAGVGVHVLPGRGAADGGRPGHHPGVGVAGAAVRGCAPVELRAFASPERNLVFDVNDFDETLPGRAGGRRAARDASPKRHLPGLDPRPNPVDGMDREFYVRQLRDWKFSAPIEAMIPTGMEVYARLCGWALPAAPALSSTRYSGRPAAASRTTPAGCGAACTPACWCGFVGRSRSPTCLRKGRPWAHPHARCRSLRNTRTRNGV